MLKLAGSSSGEDLRMQVFAVAGEPTASMLGVAIQVEARDGHRLLADITRVLSESRMNILSATVTTT